MATKRISLGEYGEGLGKTNVLKTACPLCGKLMANSYWDAVNQGARDHGFPAVLKHGEPAARKSCLFTIRELKLLGFDWAESSGLERPEPKWKDTGAQRKRVPTGQIDSTAVERRYLSGSGADGRRWTSMNWDVDFTAVRPTPRAFSLSTADVPGQGIAYLSPDPEQPESTEQPRQPEQTGTRVVPLEYPDEEGVGDSRFDLLLDGTEEDDD